MAIAQDADNQGAGRHPKKKAFRPHGRESKRARQRRQRRRAQVIRGSLFVAAFVALWAAAASGLFGAPGPAPANNTPMHIHPNLEIDLDGSTTFPPNNVGIEPALWRDHSLDGAAEMGTMSPLHTHSSDGVIHVESKVTREFTLQEFLSVWGVQLSYTTVINHRVEAGHGPYMTVDGQRVPIDSPLVFRDGMRVTIGCAPA